MRPIHKFFHWFVLILFIVFALLQVNDTEPILWIIGYGWVAVVAAMKLIEKIRTRDTVAGAHNRSGRTLTGSQ